MIHDPVDATPTRGTDVVLGIGLDHEAACRYPRGVSHPPAAVLLKRQDADDSDGVTTAADDAGVAVLSVAQGATWARVVALSERQGQADAARAETIRGRRVPSRFERELRDEGLMQQVFTSDDPVPARRTRRSAC